MHFITIRTIVQLLECTKSAISFSVNMYCTTIIINKGLSIMAMIQCSECGKQISDKAASCPNCGAPASTVNASSVESYISVGAVKPVRPYKKPIGPFKFFGIIALCVFGLIILSGIARSISGDEDAVSGSAPSTATERTAESKAEGQAESKESEKPSEPETIVINESDYASDIPFDEVVRNADSFAGEKVTYRGIIIQKQEQILGGMMYRIAIGGDSDNMVYANTSPNAASDIVAEDDMIDFWGEIKGETSYTSVIGGTVYLPEVDLHKLTKVDALSLVEFEDTPFVVSGYSGQTSIESAKIKSISFSFSGDLDIEMEIVGTVAGGESLSLDIKCYDKDGVSLGSESIYTSVVDGEKFRLTENFYAPAETARIEFIKD